jgi:hypothetical protein
LLLNDRFAEADSIGRIMSELFPDDPAGPAFRTAAMIGAMTAAEEDLCGRRFTALADSSIALAESKLGSADRQTAAWMHLFVGHAKAYRALYESRFGSFIKAISLGMAARSSFEAGLEQDSTAYDLYLGLGSYHYWKSAKAGLLRWLMILSNEKDKGISELYLAADSATLYGDAARSALIWVWLNEKKYDSVIALATEMSGRYPEARSFDWPRAQACFETRRYRECLAVYTSLRRSLEADPGNYFNAIECDYWIASCWEKLRRLDRAVAVAQGLDKYYGQVPDRIRRLQRTRLKFLRRLGRLPTSGEPADTTAWESFTAGD